jgi:microcystin-dependent protein
MSDPYVGEIRMFGGNFAPVDWAWCDGALLPIAEYETLFTLIGTTYGGDGQQTFALPDLRGRLPLHTGAGPGLSGYVLGQQVGVESVALSVAQTPAHSHPVSARSSPGTSTSAVGNVPASATSGGLYAAGAPSPDVAMAPNAIAPAPGGGQAHSNVMPFQCVSFIIALYGVYPTQD